MKQLLFVSVVLLSSYVSSAQVEMRITSHVKRETAVFVDGIYFNTIRQDSLQSNTLNIPVQNGIHQIVFIKKDYGDSILGFNSDNYAPISKPSMQLLAGLTMLGPILRQAYMKNRVLTFQ
jgi:hypothetical protein